MAGGYYWAFRAYCQRRPDGTYGELFGPLDFFKPYAIAFSSILLVVGIVLWAKARKS